MPKATLPVESAADLRAAATISTADIAASKAFVARMTAPARYWMGERLLTMPAKAAKRFWEAATKEAE